jgi:hypothetical protein
MLAAVIRTPDGEVAVERLKRAVPTTLVDGRGRDP